MTELESFIKKAETFVEEQEKNVSELDEFVKETQLQIVLLKNTKDSINGMGAASFLGLKKDLEKSAKKSQEKILDLGVSYKMYLNGMR